VDQIGNLECYRFVKVKGIVRWGFPRCGRRNHGTVPIDAAKRAPEMPLAAHWRALMPILKRLIDKRRNDGRSACRVGLPGAPAQAFQLFHEGDRALEDCLALLEVLAWPLPVSGVPALRQLLDNARAKTICVWAQDSPYEKRKLLKSRDYHWNDGTDGRPRAWWTEVPEQDLLAELDFLRVEVYGWATVIRTSRVTALNRHSGRLKGIRFEALLHVSVNSAAGS